MKNIQTIALLTILVVGLFSCSPQGSTVTTDESVETVGPPEKPLKQLPSFAMSEASGKVLNLGSFKGKKIFVNLWATWCPPCRAEMPSINALAGKLNKNDVAFVMLSLDEDFEDAKAYIKKQNLQLPVYYPAENLSPMFNTGSIPSTFIFNEAGELIKTQVGSDDYDTTEYFELLSKKQ